MEKELIHNNLPLRQCIADIYKAHLREVANYNKVYKPTVGVDIRMSILELRDCVNRAVKLYKKETALRDADIAMENLRDGIWAAYELKCISAGQLGIWTERLDKAGKMLGGWIKTIRNT